MDIVEKFYSNLNTSSIENRGYWTEYINSIDVEIKKIINGSSKLDSVLVIGAGNCSDIQLPTLMNNFNKVILTDIDTEAIKKGIKIQSINKKMLNKVEITKIDYTNIDYTNFFDNLISNIKSGTSFDTLKNLIDFYIAENSSNKRLDCYRGLNDLVIVSPIYSQLLLNPVFSVLEQLSMEGISIELLELVKEYVLQKMVTVIENINNEIYKLTNINGIIIAISDIFEAAEASEFSNKIKEALGDNTVDELYNEYHERYGFGLGDFGLYSLSSKGIILKEQWLLWPFSPAKNFLVKLMVIKKKY